MSARSFLFHSLALALALALCVGMSGVNAQTDLRVTSPDTAAGRLCDGMANLDLAGYDAGASYNRQTSNARDCSEQCRIKTSLVGTTPCSGWAWVSAGPNAGLCTFKVNVPLNANYTAQANRTSGFVPAGSYACPTPAPAPAVVSGFSQLTYLGCWGEVNPVGGDNNLRLLPRTTASEYRGADPIGNCLAFATSQGDTYFGLQYGYQCWSGSKYQRSDLPFSGSISSTANSGCSMTCPGAPSLNCGGGLANQVYSRRVETCAPFAWSASTTGASSSLALGNSSAVTPSWSVACFSAAIGANVSVSCATNFKVGLYDSASGELVNTLFASPSYCPRSGQVDVGSSFGAPDGSYAGRAFYLQATHVVGSAVVTLGAPLRYTVVCAAAGSAQASPVSLPGLSYTGALSGSSSEFLYAEATLPFTSAADLPVGGQFSFTLDNGASCSSPSSINGSLSIGSCRLSAPTAAGFYNVAVRFEAQTDSCTLFVAQTSVSIQVLNLQVLQAQADATVGALNAEIARATAAEAAVQANVARETARAIAAEVAIQQNFAAGLAQAATDRAAGDAALAAQLSAEVSRANSTELELRSLIKDLTGAVGALTARVTILERPAAYLFFGLANALSVSYPRGQQPGSGPANMLRMPLIFDTPLSSLGSDSLTYSPTTGQLRITAAGTYRFDAFVHLYVSQGNTVGTGVVSWQTAAGRPIGPNVLNENSNGVAQGVPGDDSLVSSLRTISASELPFTAQLVLVSMNQREATITDASVISVTRVR